MPIIARILLVVLAVAVTGYRSWVAYRAFRPDHSHLVIVPPDGWKTRSDSSKDPSAYILAANDAMEAMCTLSRWKARTGPSDFPKYVDEMASGYVLKVKDQLASEHYDVVPFTGPHCQGSYAVISMKSLPWVDKTLERCAAFFLVSVDGSEWSGHFTGTPENWAKALEMLKGIRKE